MIPARIRIGVRNRTIPNPALLNYAGAREAYQGPVSDYDFRMQKKQYEGLAALFWDYGIQFTEVAGIRYDGDVGSNHRFVALTDNPAVLWNKYVGFAAQGGQNHVFLHGRRVKVSILLSEPTDVQRALITNKVPARLRARVQKLDETEDLWS